MEVSLPLRILLLAVLPAVAALIYFEGQVFDPSLLNFEQEQAQGERGAALFPAAIEGYRLTGQVRQYSKDNLFEYVNGHAEYFLSAGFASLAVGEYGRDKSAGTAPDMIVDIYDMGRSIQAFGILSDESGGKSSEMENGLPGFSSAQGMSFVKGQYYVRMAAYNEDVPKERFAEEIAGMLAAGTDPFPEFGRLPDIGEVVRTRFIRENYRGLDFVQNVVEREYSVQEGNVQVFASTGSNSKELLRSFVDYFRQSDIQYREHASPSWRIYMVADPYEGDWALIALPDTVFGVYGSIDENIIRELCACDYTSQQ